MIQLHEIKTGSWKYLMILPMALLLAGCSQAVIETSSVPMNGVYEDPNIGAHTSEESPQERSGQGDQENKPIDIPDLYGSVKSILGNEVVLALAELPSAEMLEEKRNEERQQNLNEMAVGGTPSPEGAGGGGGSSAGSGGPGGGTGGGSGASSGTNTPKGLSSNRALELTGEEVTIMIPVGISIQAPGFEHPLDIGDIFQGSILQIWLENDDPEKILQVKLIQGG